ncbi:riboflavin synthase subunit alpha [Bacillaceae bacterium]
MFTGIIEEIGTVQRIKKQGNAIVLEIGAKKVLQDVKRGDSIAVNGVCLTVTSFSDDSFATDVVPETMRRTNFSELQVGSAVNLERAMAAGGRFGGHFVSGHIDGTGRICGMQRQENAVILTIEADPSLLRYVIPKGSIAVDGISLTVMDVEEDRFSLSIIPHTWRETVLQYRKKGDLVNLECDMIGKYVEKLLSLKTKDGRGNEQQRGKIDAAFLAEHGFL